LEFEDQKAGGFLFRIFVISEVGAGLYVSMGHVYIVNDIQYSATSFCDAGEI
jgi:hypothetical protein